MTGLEVVGAKMVLLALAGMLVISTPPPVEDINILEETKIEIVLDEAEAKVIEDSKSDIEIVKKENGEEVIYVAKVPRGLIKFAIKEYKDVPEKSLKAAHKILTGKELELQEPPPQMSMKEYTEFIKENTHMSIWQGLWADIKDLFHIRGGN